MIVFVVVFFSARPAPNASPRHRPYLDLQGAFCKVYSARHRLDGKVYAIKRTIRGVKRQSPEFAQYLQEVQILSNVPYHPGIIRYYASWTEPSTDMYDTEKLFIQLEAGSSTLKNLSLGDPLPDKALRSVAVQVLEGLEHLHAHGIAHMDIKPSNILIVRSEGREMIDETDMFSIEDGEIKLGDFGLATGCRYVVAVALVGIACRMDFQLLAFLQSPSSRNSPPLTAIVRCTYTVPGRSRGTRRSR